MLKLRWVILTIAALTIVNTADAKEHSAVAAAAPTKPVATKNLDAPAFQSDTKTLQAILNKDPEVQELGDEDALPHNEALAAPVAAAKAPAAAPKIIEGNKARSEKADTVEKFEKLDEEESSITTLLTAIRVFAIRWRDVTDIMFMLAVAVFTRRLYMVTKEQYRFMAHTVRAAEDAAAAAKRSAEIAEMLLKSQIKHDEAQGKLDLR